MTNPPKYKIGDLITWYCDEDQREHTAKVEFVNYIHVGRFFDDINYEVTLFCGGKERTVFVDENDIIE